MSDWKQRANKRRDERHTAIDPRPTGGGKRNTKRWCRGVVGREHTPRCVPHKETRLRGWFNYECSACRKVLDYYFPSPFDKPESRVRPAWVAD